MKYIVTIVLLVTGLFCTAIFAQAQKPVKPASAFKQAGVSFASPNQPGWTLVKADKTETVFEKRDDNGVSTATVKLVPTSAFPDDKARLNAWEAQKNEEYGKYKRDHFEINYLTFKGTKAMHYDMIFPLEKTPSNKYAELNVTGYMIPLANLRDSALQIEVSNYSDRRAFTEDMMALNTEFFDTLTLPKIN